MELKRGLGLSLPITKGQQGYFDTNYDTLLNEKTKLQNLFLTREGERPFQPTLGIGIYRYLFEPITNSLGTNLENEINGKVEFWLPDIKIDKLIVDITDGVDRNSIYIHIEFSLKKSNDLTLVNESITFQI